MFEFEYVECPKIGTLEDKLPQILTSVQKGGADRSGRTEDTAGSSPRWYNVSDLVNWTLFTKQSPMPESYEALEFC